MTIEQLWEQFFFHLRVERRSAATLSFYEVSRQKLAVYLCGQGWPQEVPGLTVGHLRAFVLWLGEQGLNPGGQHAHVRALRALFNWCHREELIPVNPAARLALPPLPQQRLPAATGVETQRLLRAARGWDQPLRDAALILTLFDTGLRVSEVIRVTREDLQPARGLIRVRGGKGGKGPDRSCGEQGAGCLGPTSAGNAVRAGRMSRRCCSVTGVSRSRGVGWAFVWRVWHAGPV